MSCSGSTRRRGALAWVRAMPADIVGGAAAASGLRAVRRERQSVVVGQRRRRRRQRWIWARKCDCAWSTPAPSRCPRAPRARQPRDANRASLGRARAGHGRGRALLGRRARQARRSAGDQDADRPVEQPAHSARAAHAKHGACSRCARTAPSTCWPRSSATTISCPACSCRRRWVRSPTRSPPADEARAAPLLAKHLNDPANSADDVAHAARALVKLATAAEYEDLRTFFALYRATADDEALVAAVVACAEAAAARRWRRWPSGRRARRAGSADPK